MFLIIDVSGGWEGVGGKSVWASQCIVKELCDVNLNKCGDLKIIQSCFFVLG